jgi:membrane associated rhomboid family serine protease
MTTPTDLDCSGPPRGQTDDSVPDEVRSDSAAEAAPEPPNERPPLARPTGAVLPAWEAFRRELEAARRFVPVTAALVASNVLLFAVLAVKQGRVLEFDSHLLLKWGADYGPRTFGAQQWWRLAASLFLHADLAHLAVNLVFLLLAAPLVERLVGSVRFAAVYLFAGVGAGLWALGWFPGALSVGASGAVFGVYGCFLGCFLHAPRTIPWQAFRQQTGLLLLFAVTSLVVEYLELKTSLIPHAAGLLYGFAGGLLFGPAVGSRRRVLGLLVGVAGCAVLLGATGAWTERCARPAVRLLKECDDALEEERALSDRFTALLRRWSRDELSNAEFRRLLHDELIPGLERLRTERKLSLAELDAGAEKERLSLQALLEAGRSAQPRRGEKPQQSRSTKQEFDELFRFCLKLRLDSWKSLADELNNDDPAPGLQLLDLLLVEVVRARLEDVADEDNVLHRWVDFSRRKTGPKNE